jgi:hypothetical protein
MRTTLTLDKDVAAVIERLRKTRNDSLKAIVNEALRRGLQAMSAPTRVHTHFRTESADLGRCLIAELDNVAEVLATSESEAFK